MFSFIPFFKKNLTKLSSTHITKYPDPVLNKSCAQFEVNNWIISDFLVNILVPIIGIHPYPLNEQLLLTGVVCRFKPSHIFEWGTNIGKSARMFYEISIRFNIPYTIHSIDLPDEVKHVEHPGIKRGRLVKGLNNVILYQGDGLSQSLEILDNIKNNNKCLFFLDGDHSFVSVKRELDKIFNCVSDPIVIIHDTFYQSPDSGYNIGPYLAIKEFINGKNHLYEIISTNTGLPGLSVIYKKSFFTNDPSQTDGNQ